MKRIALALIFALASCSGAGNPPPVPSPSPTPTAAPCTSAALHPNHGASPLPHLMRPRGFKAFAKSTLPYNGGSVLVNPKVYLVLWGFDSNDAVASREIELYTNVGGSQWLSTVTQYCQLPNVYITNPSGMLQAVWSDMTDPVPSTPTDAQLAAEATLAAQHFSVDQPNASVVVALPHGVVPSGFKTQYCAWHNSTSSGLSYTNLPYMPDAGQGCGAGLEGDQLAGVSIVGGHELAESITDPIPPTGWSGSGEIGDLCAWQDIQDENLNGVSLPMQPLFSNQAGKCVQ